MKLLLVRSLWKTTDAKMTTLLIRDRWKTDGCNHEAAVDSQSLENLRAQR